MCHQVIPELIHGISQPRLLQPLEIQIPKEHPLIGLGTPRFLVPEIAVIVGVESGGSSAFTFAYSTSRLSTATCRLSASRR